MDQLWMFKKHSEEGKNLAGILRSRSEDIKKGKIEKKMPYVAVVERLILVVEHSWFPKNKQRYLLDETLVVIDKEISNAEKELVEKLINQGFGLIPKIQSTATYEEFTNYDGTVTYNCLRKYARMKWLDFGRWKCGIPIFIDSESLLRCFPPPPHGEQVCLLAFFDPTRQSILLHRVHDASQNVGTDSPKNWKL